MTQIPCSEKMTEHQQVLCPYHCADGVQLSSANDQPSIGDPVLIVAFPLPVPDAVFGPLPKLTFASISPSSGDPPFLLTRRLRV
jgi:hypothetical protein